MLNQPFTSAENHRQMITQLKSIFTQRHIVFSLAAKEFASRYLGSRLGIFWGVITPVLFVVVIGIIFNQIFKLPLPHRGFFILSGFFPWAFFAESVLSSVRVLTEKKRMMVQFSFGRVNLVLAQVLSNFSYFLISLCFVLLLACYYNLQVLVLFPVAVFVVCAFCAFTIGVSLLFCIANVFLKDVRHILDFFMMFWFWATPVFYMKEMLSDRFSFFLGLNPVTPYMEAFRSVFYYCRLPSAENLLTVSVFGAVFFMAGMWVFFKSERQLLKWL